MCWFYFRSIERSAHSSKSLVLLCSSSTHRHRLWLRHISYSAFFDFKSLDALLIISRVVFLACWLIIGGGSWFVDDANLSSQCHLRRWFFPLNLTPSLSALMILVIDAATIGCRAMRSCFGRAAEMMLPLLWR